MVETLHADEAMKRAADAASADFTKQGNVNEYLQNAISAAVSAALRALDAAGWVCVPKVATQEMVDAGSDEWWYDDALNRSLDAAPKLVKP